MRTLSAAIAALILGTLCSGCAIRNVALEQPHADPIGQRTRLDAVTFTSSIKTAGMADQQLIYNVRLLDKMYRPLRSNDGHFENNRSEVAATRALMILQSPWLIENMSVTIPAQELHVREEDLPVAAEFTVVTPNGEVVAREMVRVPLMPGWDENGPHVAWAPEAAPRRVAAAARNEPAEEAPAAADARSAMRKPPAESRKVVRGSRDAKPIAPGSEPGAASGRSTRAATAPKSAPGAREVAATSSNDAPHDSAPTAKSAPAGSTKTASALQGKSAPGKPAAPQTRSTPRATTADAGLPPPRTRATSQPAQKPPPAAASGKAPPPAARTSPAGAVTAPRATPQKPAAPTSQPASRPAWREYVVKSGDNLFTIADRELGDAERWLEIYEINRDQMSTPDELEVGTKLKLPPR